MWDPTAPVETVSRQLLNIFFSVPQLSMPLDVLPEAHRIRATELLTQWRSLREVLLGRRAACWPSQRKLPRVSARLGSTLVVAAYQPRQLDLDLAGISELVILNSTSATALPYAVLGVTPPSGSLLVEGGTAASRVALSERGFIQAAAWGITRITVGRTQHSINKKQAHGAGAPWVPAPCAVPGPAAARMRGARHPDARRRPSIQVWRRG